MKHRNPSRTALSSSSSRWLGLCSLALASSCSGSQTPPSNNTNNPPAEQQHTNEQPPDLSEVALPERAVLVVRVASPTQLAERAATLTNFPALRQQLISLYSSAFGPNADSVVDRNAPVDVMVVADPEGDPKLVLSVPTTGMDDVQAALGNSHRFTPAGNGAVRVGPGANAGNNQPGLDDQSGGADETNDLNNCVLAPTPNAGSTRMVCAEEEMARQIALPFLTRTLPRRDTPAYAVVMDAPVENLRTVYFDKWRQALDASREEFDRSAATEIQDTAVRATVLSLMHQMFDTGRAAMEDAAAFQTSLTLNEDGAVLHTQFDVRGPNGPLMRSAADAMRNQPAVPAELVNHLLPDAWMYAAVSMDGRPLAPLLNEIEQVVTAAVNAQANLAPADRQAITTALGALHILDQGTAAEEFGNDAQGHAWFASITREASTPPAQYITAMRNLTAAMRRPAVAAIVRRVLDSMKLAPGEIGALPELPARGLPAGSYGFSFPAGLLRPRPTDVNIVATPAPAPAPAGHGHGHGGGHGGGHANAGHAGNAANAGGGHGHAGGAAHAAAEPMMQILMVPNGQDVIVVMGTDAVALYNRFAANTTPGINAGELAVASGGMAMAFVMSGMPNMMRSMPNTSANDVHQFETFLSQMPDHGTTPAAFRTGVSAAGDLTRFWSDVDLPRQFIQDVAGLITSSFGAMAAPPPPASPSPATQSP